MDLPQVFVSGESSDEDQAAAELARTIVDLGIEVPFVFASTHGERIAAKLDGPHAATTPPPAADQRWAAELGSAARRSGADGIVAIGGGRRLDIAKLAAARAGLQFVATPTQLSHDGICSPVAVVPNEEGRSESLGAVEPKAVFLSMPTLLGASLRSVTAGIGDLMANPLALRDWALAAERGLDEIDQRAWDLSVHAYELIEPHLDDDPAVMAKDVTVLATLGEALIQSGFAMISSGTSRPASGGEHEISHALDELFDGPAMHGEQVAFGSVVSVALYEEDTDLFRKRLRRLGLPQEPGDLGLSNDDIVRVILEAPNTRPGRFTVLENADMDEAAVRKLVEGIWS